ncbi:DUF6320 domain-containing protein [Hespellia stercorisuis]|uniref:Uncharacterized protein, contains a NRPS condensation (Elongation) domain n=1 Tax=Hespellia stercorisuis DSM 15480 TaxID=1121950 RepID=A0A1M6QNW3_9FIRM|nr:DUF6320 domain-containing protein [Hespellia stercorisuis]SHK21972.1 Uncharacterized protein, contains a NRPS condensation (elongation) domain [Hespellia stercorisuis DSM 15480]
MRQSKRAYWRKLDNAAKLFPATSNERDTRVFRFYCELRETIVEELLQKAVDKTLKKYPVFLSVMRKGLFWHYLEKSELRPVVREENKEPCSNIYVKDKKSLLFEVTYYKKRINFEVYHALTDGTGATEFLRELVKNYLVIAHAEEELADMPLLTKEITVADQEDDGFNKYYSKKGSAGKQKKKKAFQIKRPNKEFGELQVTEATMSVGQLLKRSRELGVSMTVLLSTVFLCAIHEEMTKLQEHKPVVLMVPVNLRKFFPSSSMLNFFWWIEPFYQFGGEDDSFEAVLAHVKTFFKEELTQEKISENMNTLISLEHHPILRLAPLELKNLCINAGARFSERDTTAIFSNMSVVSMPEVYEPYIRRFGVFTSTPKVELCMCSFRDTITLGFTSRHDSTNIQRNFFRILSELGVDSVIEEPEYPPERHERSIGAMFFKGFSFACLVLIVAAVAVDVCLKMKFHWPLWAAGGVASMWMALAIGFSKRHNLLKNAMWQLIAVPVMCILWDVFTGWKGWSIDYVLPAVCVLVQLSMFIISRLQSHTAREYMIYYVMASGYGIVVPLVLMLVHCVSLTFPSVICIGVSFIMLMALVIFKGRELKEEMQKKFHL